MYTYQKRLLLGPRRTVESGIYRLFHDFREGSRPPMASLENVEKRLHSGVLDQQAYKHSIRFTAKLRSVFSMATKSEKTRLTDITPKEFDTYTFIAFLMSNPYWRRISENRRIQILKNLLLPNSVDTFFKPSKLITTFGIESECFGLRNRQREFYIKMLTGCMNADWDYHNDITIEPSDETSGIEVISSVSDSNNFHQVFLYVALLHTMGAKTNESCGLHAHAGMTDTFDDPDFRLDLTKQLILNYIEIERKLSFLDSGLIDNYSDIEDNNYMNKLLASTWDDMPGAYKNGINIFNPLNRRRSKINFCPLGVYGTAEFRHHPGTTSPVEIFAWVKFLNSFIKTSATMVQKNSEPHIPQGEERTKLSRLVTQFKRERSLPLILQENCMQERRLAA